MINNINTLDWLLEEDEQPALQAPTSEPQFPPGDENNSIPPDDVTQDPQLPDFSSEKEENLTKKKKSFDEWKHNFLELSIKSDLNEMLDMIGKIKDRNLEPHNRKFVDDNLQILLYRQDDNVKSATKKIRNLIKEDLDKTNPGTTLMQHITSVIEEDPVLQQIPIKLSGMHSMKGDTHRKWIAALLGAIQIGGGGSKPDILYVGTDYTINISTRFATQFDEINLSKWTLKTDDPERYLTDSELDDLHEGSPDLKQALRRKVIMESIAQKFEERSFLIHVVSMDGTISSLGWDMGDSLLAGYTDGKVIVHTKKSEVKDAMITSDGEIVQLDNAEILFIKDTGDVDENGKPAKEEVPLIQQREGSIYLASDMNTVQVASSTMTGMFFRESPFNGNPSEVNTIRNCVITLPELLGKKCL